MPEQVLINESQGSKTADSEPRIGAEFVEFLQEIQATPRESWPQLIQIMRLFREAVTKEHKVSDISIPAKDTNGKFDPIEQHKALSELLRSWREEGDEEDQKETWEILSKALDRGGVSI
jgi:hypothetical protein